MPQPVGADLKPIERRASDGVSPIGSTAGIPTGTLLHVPAAPPEGPIPNAPVVAVTTQSWTESVSLRIMAALPFADVLAQQLAEYMKWSKHAHHLVVLVCALWLAWRHLWQNRVTRFP